MKLRAFYNKEQFSIKIRMSDGVWDDMDDDMLDKVTEFESHLNSKLWAMFVEYLKIPQSCLIDESQNVKLKNERMCGKGAI